MSSCKAQEGAHADYPTGQPGLLVFQVHGFHRRAPAEARILTRMRSDRTRCRALADCYAKLLHAAIKGRNRLARKCGLQLRQYICASPSVPR